MTLTDLFCSAQVLSPESGDVFLAGGDFWNGKLTETVGNSMNKPRWHATMTVLTNGEIYIQGGLGGTAFAEVRTASGSFRKLTSVKTSG